MGFYPTGCQIGSLSEGNEIHLNRMNYEQFEQMLPDAGFHIIRRQTSESIGRLCTWLLKIPRLKHYLTGTVYYVLA